jgi:hypothetical protein
MREPAERRVRAEPLNDDWLTAICRCVRWNERELMKVLAGLRPSQADGEAPKSREQLVAEAGRSEVVRRHVDDAIAIGELRVTMKLGMSDLDRIQDANQRARFANAAYANALYGERYVVTPAEAIRWFNHDARSFQPAASNPRISRSRRAVKCLRRRRNHRR